MPKDKKEQKEEQVISLDMSLSSEPENEQSEVKRGWIFDELIKVGQLEAAMGHNDEQICNLHQQLDDAEVYSRDEDELQKIAEELNTNYELIKLDYANRVDCLNGIFDAVPSSDRHYYCQVKHRAMAYVIAGENFHARNCCEEAERSLVQAGKSLALTCSLAFGFEPMECLRCLDEALKKHI